MGAHNHVVHDCPFLAFSSSFFPSFFLGRSKVECSLAIYLQKRAEESGGVDIVQFGGFCLAKSIL